MKLKISTLFFFFLSSISYCQIVVPTPNGYQLIDDDDGEQISKYTYDFIGNPSERLCIFYSATYGDFSYVSTAGKVAISGDFDIAYPFKGHFALVADNGEYFYINVKGDQFGRLNWPKAPEVYDEFLIVSDSLSRVYHKDGELVLESPNQLIATSGSGILEWNKDSSWVKQYVKGSSYGKIRKANHISNVTNLVTTWQDYACIELDSIFSIYDDRGDLLFENQPSQNYYLPVKVVWRNYLYLPDQHHSIRFERELYSEPLYPANQMHHNYGYNTYGAAVLIGEGFYNERVALLSGTEKWALYNSGHTIVGSYLFDEVLPSDDKEILLVRQDTKWSIYSKRTDSLKTLGYRFIHPRGLFNGIFFSSNDPNNLEDKKWSLSCAFREFGDLKLELSDDEVYQFPKKYYTTPKYRDAQRIKTLVPEDYLFLLRGDSSVVINKSGKEVYQHKIDTKNHLQIQDFFMPYFCLREDVQKPLDNKKGLRRNEVGLYLSVDGQEIEVVLANTTKEPFLQVQHGVVKVDHTYEEGLIEVYLEYQNRKGDWQPITRFPGDTNEDWQRATKLMPNNCLKASITFPEGPIGPRHNVRAKMIQNDGISTIYSNTVQMNLFPGLLYGNPYFEKYGAISKYQLITNQ